MKKILLILLLCSTAQAIILKPIRGSQTNKTNWLTRGLIGCWLMNENTGQRTYDSSGYHNTGTLTNMTNSDWVAGPYGSALDFDGSNDKIDIHNNPVLFVEYITIACWMKRNGQQTSYTKIIYGGRNSTSPWGCGLEFYSSYERLKFSCAINGTARSAIDPDVLPDDTWTFVVGTYDGTIMKLYKDTVIAATLSASGVIDSWYNTPWAIGGKFDTGQTLNGKISSVMIWDRALSTSEIRQLYMNSFSMFSGPSNVITGDVSAPAGVGRIIFMGIF